MRLAVDPSVDRLREGIRARLVARPAAIAFNLHSPPSTLTDWFKPIPSCLGLSAAQLEMKAAHHRVAALSARPSCRPRIARTLLLDRVGRSRGHFNSSRSQPYGHAHSCDAGRGTPWVAERAIRSDPGPSTELEAVAAGAQRSSVNAVVADRIDESHHCVLRGWIIPRRRAAHSGRPRPQAGPARRGGGQ